MSTQITLPAQRRMPFGRGWMAAVVVALSLGLAATTYMALRSDGGASPKPAIVAPAAGIPTPAGSLSGTSSDRVGTANAQPAAAIPHAHNAAGFKRGADRPAWEGPASRPAQAGDGGCMVIGRVPC
jgi:hypothetical protein